MALHINDAVDLLAHEVARLTGESKTEAIRKALEERLQRLKATERRQAVLAFLENSVWPQLPKDEIGRALTKPEEDAILGY